MVAKCRHNNHQPCFDCEKSDTAECTVMRVIADANVVVQAFQEDRLTDQATDFLNNASRRDSVRIVLTHEIAGEIFTALMGLEPELRLRALETLAEKYWGSFEIIETPFNEPVFNRLLELVFGLNSGIRCGGRDKLHCAVAIFYGLTLYSFDTDLHQDSKTINKALEVFSREEGKSYKLDVELIS